MRNTIICFHPCPKPHALRHTVSSKAETAMKIRREMNSGAVSKQPLKKNKIIEIL